MGYLPAPQTAFIRIISNKKSYPAGPQPEEAIELLIASISASPKHEFWAADLPISRWSPGPRSRIRGHRQITDAYLIALAAHHGGKLVTFDRGIVQLALPGTSEASALIVLS